MVMAPGLDTHRSSLPETTYHLPLLVSPLRHKSPSLPVMLHSPSLQALNFHPLSLQPLNAFRANFPVYSFPEAITEYNDPTPRPLSIKKLRKSPSMPLSMIGVRDSRSTSQFSRRFPPQPKSPLGLSLPPQPKPRSSSAGVLLGDKNSRLSSNQTSGVNTIRRSSTQCNGERKELPSAGMSWLQKPQSFRDSAGMPTTSQSSCVGEIPCEHTSTPTSGYMTAPTTCPPTPPGSSFHSCSHPSIELELPAIPTQIDLEMSERGRKGAFKFRRASSTGGMRRNKREGSAEPRRASTTTKGQVPSESTEKFMARGWKEKVFPRDFFTRAGGGANTPQKEAKIKGRIRGDGPPLSTTVKTVQIPRTLTAREQFSPTKQVDTPFNHSWCQTGSRVQWNDGSRGQLDGNDERNSAGNFLGSGYKGAFNDSVLGIFEGSIGSMTRTTLKKASHWKPPVLQLQMEIVSETEKVPISYPGSHGNENVVWVSVELDGKVDCGTEGFEGSKVGLDVGVLIDISAYTSSTSFASMKLHAKRIVEAMETSRDRVAVMTFPSTPSNTRIPLVRPDTVHVLNSAGSVAKRQLIDDIGALSQNKRYTDPISRNVRAAVQASVQKLKGMPLDTARYGTHRHGHLFLLTTKLDDGEIELLPEVFFGEIQIHIIGIGPIFWPRNEMGASGWCIPTGTLGLRPNPTNKRFNLCKEKKLEKQIKGEISIEEMVCLLRTAVDLGVLYDVYIKLDAGEHCAIRAVMGDLQYAKFLPGEKRTLLVQVRVGDMPIPEITNQFDLSGNDETMPRWVILERQLEAALGELQGRLLTVRATYRHANFPRETVFSTERNVEISRFAEDSLWRFSPTGNKLISGKLPPMVPMTAKYYVKKVLVHRVASMHSSPTRALRAVQEISSAAATREIDLADILKELFYREKIEKRFKEARIRYKDTKTETSNDHMEASNDSSHKFSPSWESTTTFVPTFPETQVDISSQILSGLPIDQDCRYRGSRELHNEDRAPFIAAVDPSPDTEILDADPEDEAQRIWLEIKLRQRGVSSGSIKRRPKKSSSLCGKPQLEEQPSNKEERGGILGNMYSSTAVSGEDIEGDIPDIEEKIESQEKRGSLGQDTLRSLATLRDIRETDFGPWAM